MLIEIKGVQFINKGAELMLHAVLQQVQQLWPGADIVLAPNANSPYKSRALLGAYQKLPLQKGRLQWHGLGYYFSPKLRGWLKHRLGLVTEADIDLVLDASGFAYGDQWPAASVKLLCAEIARYAKAGKKYILLPQAFGPFSRSEDISLLRQALPKATLVCARDNVSLGYLRALNPAATNIECYPDFTNLVKPQLPDYYQQGEQKVLFIPNSNMLSSRNTNSAWADQYIPLLLQLMGIVRTAGFTPVLLNHEGSEDAALCRNLLQLSGMNYQIINETDPLKVKGIIGASAAVVCSRFHGCVSALSQGVACLGTSWSHKYEQLFAAYGCEQALLTPELGVRDLEQRFLQALENVKSDTSQQLRAQQMAASQALWQKVAAVVG